MILEADFERRVTMTNKFDLAVIGTGAAASSAARSERTFDDSIPRIRAAEEGRPDATQGIEDDHASRRIAQRDLRQIARRSERGGSCGGRQGFFRLLSTIAARYKDKDVDYRKSEKSRFRTELI